MPETLPEDDDEDADEQGQSFDYSDVYPYLDGDSQEIDALDEPDGEDSGEEETEPPTSIGPAPPKIDWRE